MTFNNYWLIYWYLLKHVNPWDQITGQTIDYFISWKTSISENNSIKAIIHQIVKMKKLSFGRFYVSTKFSGDFDFVPDEDVFEDYTQEHLEEYVLKIKAWKKRM